MGRRQVRVLEVGEGQVKAGRLHAKTSSWMVSLEALVSSCETDCFGFVKPFENFKCRYFSHVQLYEKHFMRNMH